jgi:hypothetical protein
MVKQPNPNAASGLRLIHRQETGEEMSSADWRTAVSKSLMQSRESGHRPAAVSFGFGRFSFLFQSSPLVRWPVVPAVGPHLPTTHYSCRPVSP